MSISRKNWSALSSLARQRTVEDEEEVERERRRRVKSSSSCSDKDAPSRTTSSNDSPGSDSKTEETSSLEQIQLDFVEMLRVRDETRRVRLVETLRKQKAEEEEEEEEGEPVTFKRNERRRGTESRVEPRGNMKEEQDMVFAPEQTTSTQGPASGSSGSDDTNPNMIKKEEDVSPLQRSSSVRVATKRFENNTVENGEEKISHFARNSKQRLSSRSIQEKLERLAQAAQKSEMSRPADVSHRTLLLLDEVSRKRGLFEREEPRQVSSGSPVVSRQDFRSQASGMSQGINQWMNKNSASGSFVSVSELRNVNINSKRTLFENRDEGDGGVSNTRAVHVFK
ncbi:ladinin-1 [Cynoglossus semilaevis]|uniref:ladinin-1 n=1 Tax=Cynoglossus semilaevis TaxID=244447 RepID=UPI000D631683|nr:ladinin-1 [Cynoglossus semilaevis]